MAVYRGFQDEYYHDEHIVDMWNRTVRSKKDLTYILGDITLENHKHYHTLDRLMGRKIVCLGNHDRLQDVAELLKHVDSVFGVMEYKGYVLSHIPIHPHEVGRYKANIHGHIHQGDIPNPKYINVCMENIGYRPVTLEEILLIRKQKEQKYDENAE